MKIFFTFDVFGIALAFLLSIVFTFFSIPSIIRPFIEKQLHHVEKNAVLHILIGNHPPKPLACEWTA